MKCKACGTPLQEGDRICRICGTATGQADGKTADSEVSGSPEFQWNVYDFPKPRKTDEIDFKWGDVSNKEEVKEPFEVELFKEIENMESQDRNAAIEKFFTFNKRNEEFQSLLDREYEKIKSDSFPVEQQSSEKPFEEATPETILSAAFIIEEPETVEDSDLVAPEAAISEEAPQELQSEEAPQELEAAEASEEQIAPEEHKEPTVPEKQIIKEAEPPLWFEKDEEDPEEEEPKGSGCVSRALLIIIILFLVAEVGALGIKYFLPGSEAADKVTEIQITMSETLDRWVEDTAAFFKDLRSNESEPADEGDITDVVEEPQEDEGPADSTPDPLPSTDKEALIQSQLSVNENIETVKANDMLAYKIGTDYKVADLNNSKPLENNLWIDADGTTPHYYDQEIVETLIAFDSKWNEYVNGGDKDVLSLTKEGSKAYNNVSSYSKVGKVQQQFVLLEIGEIRQGTEGFYVWTYEEIKETENNTTTYKKYKWIYKLEQVGDKMMVADYYRY